MDSPDPFLPYPSSADRRPPTSRSETIHVADQSGSSIVIAWGEPLRVGAGGLQGTSNPPIPGTGRAGSNLAGEVVRSTH